MDRMAGKLHSLVLGLARHVDERDHLVDTSAIVDIDLCHLIGISSARDNGSLGKKQWGHLQAAYKQFVY